MTCRYVGTRDRYWEGYKAKRGAEISYDDENQRERELFERTFSTMVANGWDIESGVPGWAFCEVFDREEYDQFMEDWKAAKRKARTP